MSANKKEQTENKKESSFKNIDSSINLRDYVKEFDTREDLKYGTMTYISFCGGCTVSMINGKLRIEIEKEKGK